MSFPLSKKLFLAAIALGAPLMIHQVSRGQNSPQQAVTINFQAKVGKQAFACGKSYSDLGTVPTAVMPNDFRLYLSDIALVDANGKAIPLKLEQDGKWQYQNVALLDFENKSGGCSNGTVETRNKIIGTVPPGDYQGLQFTLGIPAQLNHADATLAASPLNLTSLWWNWRGGYKFLRLDLQNQHTALKHEAGKMQNHQQNHPMNSQTESDRGFPIHIGSTGCQGDTETQQPSDCSNPNQSRIELDNFNPEQNVVVANVASLLTKTNLNTNQPDSPMGCMSSPEDQDCLGIMHNLGLAFGHKPTSGQTFFQVE
jgi:uncharacterized repeat protein (TIGR04052 family)